MTIKLDQHVQNKKTHAEEIEKTIFELLQKLPPGSFLPSAKTLGFQFKASRTTINKVIQKLSIKKLIICRKGRCPQIPDGSTLKQNIILREDLAELFYREITSNIENGLYRSGEMLPKKTYLAKQFHLSERKISIGMQRLLSDGYIYKKGKGFVVGSIKSQQIKLSEVSAILIVQPSISSWRSLFNGRTEQFAWELELQLQRHQLHAYHVAMNQDDRAERTIFWDDITIKNFIVNLGSKYRGTLLLGSRQEMPELDRISLYLRQFNKPVVWFDRYDQGSLPYKSGLYRCHFSEEVAFKALFEYLQLRGHSCLFFPVIDSEEWIDERKRRLISFAKKYNISFYEQPTYHNLLKDYLSNNSESFIQKEIEKYNNLDFEYTFELTNVKFWREPEVFSEIEKDERFRYLLLLKSAIDNNVSVIVSPNDWFGSRYLSLLERARKKIPQEISIISFDNKHGLSHRPLTSVDFGFASLAYSSIHLILQDLPSHILKKRDIPASAMVIERGSVGNKE